MITAFAVIFTILIAIAVGFQFALALGAPWGEWAMGGRWRGVLPRALRFAAVFQAFALLGLVAIVLAHTGLINWDIPVWMIWVVVVVMAASSVMNVATPSRKERLLWAPIVTLAFLSALAIGFLV
ncbi:MAG: hypothetical protein OSA52_04935 [Yoonia sp.]|jgi:hypothetical protein|nr:hypothetical protein [Yoonia sp.]